MHILNGVCLVATIKQYLHFVYSLVTSIIFIVHIKRNFCRYVCFVLFAFYFIFFIVSLCYIVSICRVKTLCISVFS